MPSLPPPPNVLLVIADDHRADAIGALGHSTVQTPVLDELVRQGTAFTRTGIMGSLMPAVCAPSRACLLTGRNLFRAVAEPGVTRDSEVEVGLPVDAITLPECLRAAGYETFHTGKWHNDVPSLLRSYEGGRAIFKGGMCDHTAVPLRTLADFHAGAPARVAAGFSTDIFCETAAAFIRERPRDRPFFASVALTSPHDPRTPPATFRALYDPGRVPLPANFLPDHPFDNGELHIRDETLGAKPLQPAWLREELANYYGMISHHDAAIGRIFSALRETGQEENTIVIYLSDHGLALGSHGLLGKQNLYEPSFRVPFILRGPGVPSGERHPTPAYSLDLFATVCELTHVRAPAGLDSRSLVPAFSDAALRVREELFAAYMDTQRMITDDRWKLLVYHVADTTHLQLFDLANDSHELHDLSQDPQHHETVKRLQEKLAAWQRKTDDRWWS